MSADQQLTYGVADNSNCIEQQRCELDHYEFGDYGVTSAGELTCDILDVAVLDISIAEPDDAKQENCGTYRTELVCEDIAEVEGVVPFTQLCKSLFGIFILLCKLFAEVEHYLSERSFDQIHKEHDNEADLERH